MSLARTIACLVGVGLFSIQALASHATSCQGWSCWRYLGQKEAASTEVKAVPYVFRDESPSFGLQKEVDIQALLIRESEHHHEVVVVRFNDDGSVKQENHFGWTDKHYREAKAILDFDSQEDEIFSVAVEEHEGQERLLLTETQGGRTLVFEKLIEPIVTTEVDYASLKGKWEHTWTHLQGYFGYPPNEKMSVLIDAEGKLTYDLGEQTRPEENYGFTRVQSGHQALTLEGKPVLQVLFSHGSLFHTLKGEIRQLIMINRVKKDGQIFIVHLVFSKTN